MKIVTESGLTLAEISRRFCVHQRKTRISWKQSGYRVASINRGQCYRWAYIVHKIFGAELCNLPGHAFVKMHGRYYDAECLRGVVNWRRLPLVKKAIQDGRTVPEVKILTPAKFQESWAVDDEEIEKEMEIMGITSRLKQTRSQANCGSQAQLV